MVVQAETRGIHLQTSYYSLSSKQAKYTIYGCWAVVGVEVKYGSCGNLNGGRK